MGKAVFGIAATEFQAEGIFNELKVSGFSDADISVLLSNKTKTEAQLKKSAANQPLGWAAGIQPVSISGVGSFIATGPLLAALKGASAGISPDAIAATLGGMGLSRTDARGVAQKIRNGGILVAVHGEKTEEADRAQAIFTQAGASDVILTEEVSLPPPEVRDEKWEMW